ncbi:Biogenesis of lysosome-related organelles complex 1 subunit 2 [Papilio machaon]|uniref:Biogenesis of lysosome-related organelles complex 1 subunit 2 n=1 Tax=Papilio machaon TaxID=76193 RepID=A0A194QPG8_PAPMA|nr:biogenesis of lysosome-related organelles complex 1 subunit 2 [Papilio machaon]KPJ07428.1 Biogenesis of lysosome-related organelles complex 1 subunit 2 [Papilio machaon]
MSEEDDTWTADRKNKDMRMFQSCSSFELSDPHDPVLSRLATQMFKRTNDYLQGEMTAGQDHYVLLEEINRLVITKYADLRSLAVNLTKSINESNEKYETEIKPLLQHIEDIDNEMSVLEATAFRLDSYTKQLLARFVELLDIDNNSNEK